MLSLELEQNEGDPDGGEDDRPGGLTFADFDFNDGGGEPFVGGDDLASHHHAGTSTTARTGDLTSSATNRVSQLDDARARRAAVKRHLADGQLSKAAAVLQSDGVAPGTASTISELRRLHPDPRNLPPQVQHSSASTGTDFDVQLANDHRRPFGGNPPGGSTDRAEEKLTLESLIEVVKGLRFDAAPGPTGWTNLMVQDLVSSCEEFAVVLHDMGMLMFKGTLGLRDWFTSSRLIALKKKGGGVRPVACGETFTRLFGRWVFRVLERREGDLLSCQFGVGSSGGVEPVVWFIRGDIISDDSGDQDEENEEVDLNRVTSFDGSASANLNKSGWASLDFSNAFNAVSRKLIAEEVRRRAPLLFRLARYQYGEPSKLVARTSTARRGAQGEGGGGDDSSGHTIQAHVIDSRMGVRQGDPLGPFLFSLAMRPLIERLQDHLGDRAGVILAYLDDVFVKINGPTEEARKEVFDDIVDFMTRIDNNDDGHGGGFTKSNLKINPKKCWYLGKDQLRARGHEILGTWVGGPNDYFTNEGAAELADAITDRVERYTKQVFDLGMTLQERLLLLRYCWAPKLGHLLRTMHPGIMSKAAGRFDDVIVRAVLDMAENLDPLDPPPEETTTARTTTGRAPSLPQAVAQAPPTTATARRGLGTGLLPLPPSSTVPSLFPVPPRRPDLRITAVYRDSQSSGAPTPPPDDAIEEGEEETPPTDEVYDHPNHRDRNRGPSFSDRLIIGLPIRMGGLGLLSQQDISPLAFGSSFTLSSLELSKRGVGLGPAVIEEARPFVTQCADSTGLHADGLLRPFEFLERTGDSSHQTLTQAAEEEDDDADAPPPPSSSSTRGVASDRAQLWSSLSVTQENDEDDTTTATAQPDSQSTEPAATTSQGQLSVDPEVRTRLMIKTGGLQRLATLELHEKNWASLFGSLNDLGRRRLCELGQSALSSAWLTAIPSTPSLTVSDECARYAIRRHLLREFLHSPPLPAIAMPGTTTGAASTSMSPRCPHCNTSQARDGRHFLQCQHPQLKSRQTNRHTIIKKEVAKAFKNDKKLTVLNEHREGNLIHDITVQGLGTTERLVIDVSIVNNQERWWRGSRPLPRTRRHGPGGRITTGLPPPPWDEIMARGDDDYQGGTRQGPSNFGDVIPMDYPQEEEIMDKAKELLEVAKSREYAAAYHAQGGPAQEEGGERRGPRSMVTNNPEVWKAMARRKILCELAVANALEGRVREKIRKYRQFLSDVNNTAGAHPVRFLPCVMTAHGAIASGCAETFKLANAAVLRRIQSDQKEGTEAEVALAPSTKYLKRRWLTIRTSILLLRFGSLLGQAWGLAPGQLGDARGITTTVPRQRHHRQIPIPTTTAVTSHHHQQQRRTARDPTRQRSSTTTTTTSRQHRDQGASTSSNRQLQGRPTERRQGAGRT